MENHIISTGKNVIDLQIKALKKLKNSLDSNFEKAIKKIIKCKLRALPNEIQGGIATSIIFSAWNVAVYVNQIDDFKVIEAEKTKKYQQVVARIINKNMGLYFNNELFVISKI